VNIDNRRCLTPCTLAETAILWKQEPIYIQFSYNPPCRYHLQILSPLGMEPKGCYWGDPCFHVSIHRQFAGEDELWTLDTFWELEEDICFRRVWNLLILFSVIILTSCLHASDVKKNLYLTITHVFKVFLQSRNNEADFEEKRCYVPNIIKHAVKMLIYFIE
jgi:hypothetical protein